MALEENIRKSCSSHQKMPKIFTLRDKLEEVHQSIDNSTKLLQPQYDGFCWTIKSQEDQDDQSFLETTIDTGFLVDDDQSADQLADSKDPLKKLLEEDDAKSCSNFLDDLLNDADPDLDHYYSLLYPMDTSAIRRTTTEVSAKADHPTGTSDRVCQTLMDVLSGQRAAAETTGELKPALIITLCQFFHPFANNYRCKKNLVRKQASRLSCLIIQNTCCASSKKYALKVAQHQHKGFNCCVAAGLGGKL